MAETLIPTCTRGIPSNFQNSRSSTAPRRRFPAPVTSIYGHSYPKTAFGFPTRSFGVQRRVLRAEAASSSSSVGEETKGHEESMGIDALHRFIDLNLGKWNGSFYVSSACSTWVYYGLFFRFLGFLGLLSMGFEIAAIRCSRELAADCKHEAFGQLLWGGWTDQSHSNVSFFD